MTTTATLPAGTRPGVLYPHAQWYFLLAIALTWLGFSQTYFIVLPREPWLHHVHGALMGGWIAILVLQPILYQRGQLALHRTVGRWAVYLWMPAMVVCGYLVERRMLVLHGAPPNMLDQLAFLDLVFLVEFPAWVILSICFARNLQLHARYIVCTVLLMLPPALTRALFMMPGMDSFQRNVNVAEALVILVLLVMILDDRRRGRIWLPYPLTAVVVTVLAVLANYVKQWHWWHTVSGWIA